jgi:hypothetical protein
VADDGLTLEIDTSEIDELNKQFPEYADITLKEIMVATNSSLFMFQELIQGNTPKGAGPSHLQSSFQITNAIARGDTITGLVSTSLAHGFPIEMGREVGSPISKAGQEAIAFWIKRVWSNPPPDNKLAGVAFVVARSIVKKGFKKKQGYRMVETALKKIEKKIEAID